MHAVGTFVDEHGDWSVRARVRNVLGHFLHDKWIAHDEPDHPGHVGTCRFTAYSAMAELHEEHQSGSAQSLANRAFEFCKRPCSCGRLCKLNHVRMAHSALNRS